MTARLPGFLVDELDPACTNPMNSVGKWSTGQLAARTSPSFSGFSAPQVGEFGRCRLLPKACAKQEPGWRNAAGAPNVTYCRQVM